MSLFDAKVQPGSFEWVGKKPTYQRLRARLSLVIPLSSDNLFYRMSW